MGGTASSRTPIYAWSVRLGPLAIGEVAEAGMGRAAWRWTGPSAQRLHAHTQGHVLHIRTLLAELPAEQLTATTASPAGAPFAGVDDDLPRPHLRSAP